MTAHRANLHDTKMVIWATDLARIIYPDITKFIADGGYRKTFIKEIVKYLDAEVEIKAKNLDVMTPRWIVERTFA